MTVVKVLVKQREGKRSLAGVIFGLWIGALYATVIAGKLLVRSESDGMFHIVALIAALAWPLGYFSFSRHRSLSTRIRSDSLVLLSVFLLFCLLSCFGSPIAIKSAAYTGLTLVSAWIAIRFVLRMDAKQFETGLRIYALTIVPVLVAFAGYEYVPGVRLGLMGVLNPNAIAMVSFSAALCTTAIRNWLVRYGLMAPMFVVLYITESRASTLATLIGLTVIGYERTRSGTRNIKVLVLLGLTLGIVSLLAYWDTVWLAVDSFLQLESHHRGVESGFSGRTIVWGEIWRLFLDNPVFGIGFRAHETILGVSSHNGYLAMLAEIGIAGFVAVMYLVFSGIFLLWRKVRQPEWTFTHSILFGLCSGYLFLALFERFLINVGNPTSLLFLVAIFSATTVPLRQRNVPTRQLFTVVGSDSMRASSTST